MQHTALTKPEPVTSPAAWGKHPAFPDGARARRLATVEPRARILHVDGEPHRIVNGRREYAGAMLSALAHFARVQAYPHGGIND